MTTMGIYEQCTATLLIRTTDPISIGLVRSEGFFISVGFRDRVTKIFAIASSFDGNFLPSYQHKSYVVD